MTREEDAPGVDDGSDGNHGADGDRRATTGRGTDATGDDVPGGTDGERVDGDGELPDEIVTEAVRLTRLGRAAVDPGERTACEREREALLAGYDFTARVREEDDTLVCHPAEWVADGEVQFERIEDTDRAVEVPLTGAGDDDAWEDVEAHNAGLVASVEDEHGAVHAANARAFADFMGNHYASRIEHASADQLREFVDDYFRRNAWPSEAQRAVLDESLRLLFDVADAELPHY
jgi:hypothetical protein